MKPTEPNTRLVQCPCGWSRRMASGSAQADEALRYHRIQVHNDQKQAHGNF